MICELLKQGKESATPTDELIRITGVMSARELQQLISEERRAGALILSSARGGYYLPDVGDKGKAEIAEFINTLRARALNTLRVLRAAKNALRDNGQLKFEDSKGGEEQ